MKLLVLAPLPPPINGQSLAVQSLLEQFKCDGYSVLTVNLSKNTGLLGESNLLRILEIFRIAWRVLHVKNDFDFVYLTTSESIAGNLKDMLLLVTLGRLRAKTWLHLHGGAGMRNLLANRSGLIGRLNAFFLKRVAGVIVLGDRLKPIFDGYVESERIHIVKNFADDTVFIEMEHIIAKWSDTSILRVLFLSNLLLGKGYGDLLQAIRSLPLPLASRMQFDFAGGFESANDENRFRAAIADFPRVNYHGIVKGKVKEKLLEQAHVFCLPTYYSYEGQPISILEAYASGCVVLTTDHSGIFDIFTPGENGWKVEPRNPASIVAALQAVANAPAEAGEIAVQNAQLAKLRYTKKAHMSALYGALGLRKSE